MSILLHFNQILKLKEHESDLFYIRFRVPQVFYDDQSGLFRNFREEWIHYYCDSAVLTENCVLHLPSDMVVNHLVHLVCPISNRLRNDSAWNLKIQVLNAEYVVENYNFVVISDEKDFQMRTNWNRILNRNPQVHADLIDPFLDVVHDHLNQVINHEWMNIHEKSSRLMAVQRHLRINEERMQQMLLEGTTTNNIAQGDALQRVPPLEPISQADIRAFQKRRRKSQQQQQREEMEVDEQVRIEDDICSMKSDEFGDC